MKAIVLPCSLATLLIISASVKAFSPAFSDDMKRYQIESGVVEFKLTGAQKGTEIIYFDRWGMREVKYTKSELNIMGTKQVTNRLTLMDGDWITTVDLEKKTGTKMKNTILKSMMEKMKGKDVTAIAEQMLKQMGGKKIGIEQVAGKTCDVWEVEKLGSKSWVWKSIALKTQVKMMGMEMGSVATKMQEGGSIPQDKFVIPAGVKITEQDLNKMFQQPKTKSKK